MSKSGGVTTRAARAVIDLDTLSAMLKHIAAGSARTRVDLARVMGLARSTVSQRIDALLAAELIVERGTAASSGGRPALLLRLNTQAGLILSADLGATHAWLALSDLGGQPLAEIDNDITIDQEPRQVLDGVDQRFSELLAKAGCDAQQVRVIAVGVPAPVELPVGKVVSPPLMPQWDDYSVPEYFEERYPAAQIVVDNDVNLMARGEHQEHYRDVKHLLFVKFGTGIGCGIIIDGEPHSGAQGCAGDIGHIRLPNSDTPCRCGKSGCLEAVAGGGALAKELHYLNAATARDVAQLAAKGELRARRAISLAAQRIGEVLAAIISFANPEVIILGGSLARFNETLLADIRSGIYNRALPLATRSLRIETSKLDERAGTIGAISLAQQRIFSPTGVAKLLDAQHSPGK